MWCYAQSGCPGCTITLPALPADTAYLSDLPDGIAGQPYDEDFSFRMPMSTDPLLAIDSTIPGGINIDEITFLSVLNLPPGLKWEINKNTFDVKNGDTDGCIRFCGTPLDTGLFVMQIQIKAKVAIISQNASFNVPIYIAPAQSSNDGFSVDNTIGCGAVTTNFTNNNPSNGNSGYSYNWNFGNGNTSKDENPAPQTYNTPGEYIVSYEAIIDTVGYILTGVKVNAVGCGDLIGPPDIFIKISNPAGTVILETPHIANTNPPVSFVTDITLGTGNYSVEVIDNDTGLEGADDPCGTIPFNQLSNGVLSAGDLEIELTIIHPVTTITSTDTIVVLEAPATPAIDVLSGTTENCYGDTTVLQSSYSENNQWFLDSMPIIGAVNDEFSAPISGMYSVLYVSDNGCQAMSDPLNLIFHDLPAQPKFAQDQNDLTLQDFVPLPAQYGLQWYLNGTAIPDATGKSYCMQENGNYTLEITDISTGCINTSTLTGLIYDPDVECITAFEETHPLAQVKVFPNPVSDVLYITNIFKKCEYSLLDIAGREVHTGITVTSQSGFQIDMQNINKGLYVLRITCIQNGASEAFRVLR